MDKRRPVLVLTREAVLPHLTNVTVAPITRTIRGLSTEVGLGTHNGLRQDCVASCDNITTIPKGRLVRPVGYLLTAQELALAAAITAAFNLTHPG